MSASVTRFLFNFIIAFTFATTSEANFPAGTFWKRRASTLKFTTAAQTIFASNCSGVVTVQNINAQGVATNLGSSLTVNLSGTGSVTFYSNSSCTTATTSVTIPSGSNSISFYYADTVAESFAINASANNYVTISQSGTTTSSPFVWTGAGGNVNWTTANNWSGGAAPSTSAHVAIFDGTCNSNCSPTLNANVSIGGIRIESGYSGTITQGSYTITIANNGWVQKAGTFAGGSGAITIAPRFAVTGGSFQSTSDVLTVTASATSDHFLVTSPATFAHNSGTLAFRQWNTPFTLPSGTILNHFMLGNGFNGETHAITGSPVINGTFTMNVPANGSVSGTLTAKSNIVFTSGGISPNALLNLTGGAGVTQEITGAAANYILPLNINTAGTVKFNTTGSPFIAGPFTYTAGTVVWTNQNIGFVGSGLLTVVTSNGLSFPNVVFGNLNGSGIILGDTMTITGNLTTAAKGCSSCVGVSGGAIVLKGNLVSDASWAGYSGFSSPLTFSGTVAQTWKETSGAPYNGTVTIANAAGVSLVAGSTIAVGPGVTTLSTVVSSGSFNLSGASYSTTSLSLNGITLTKSAGTLKVNGTTVGTGSLYGGTVAP